MEEHFTRIVQHVFNNWTALKLAVEHSMGGANSKQTAVECLNYMVQFCLYEQNVQVEDIQDALEDVLDQEFDMICEDDSPKEIAHILFKFLQILQQGTMEQLEEEYKKLPTSNQEWLSLSQPQVNQEVPVNESSSSDDDEAGGSKQTPMEQDEWTEVKSRRKK
ncbi:unnamed protein product [Brassicogethes aeneus]|uniref:Pre-rRNA-processing protein TSR2 homolog n=1 Tax=Brassicogethes aeneus TaxID=1431903 RepID=A0A9P0ARX6_BRAAE|nr:unnamed protein product [Brassicogethes aeneus]